MLFSCSAPAKGPARGVGAAGAVAAAGAGAVPAGGVVIAEQPTCAADNPFCSMSPLITSTSTGGAPVIPTTTSCGSVPIDLRPAGVNIMLAVDGSASMQMHWADIATAIRSLRASNPTAAFGVNVFWSDALDPTTQDSDQARNTTNNACLMLHSKGLDLGDYTADQLVEAMGPKPLGGVIMDVYQVASLIDSLDTYLTAPTKLADPTRTNYLLVFTNGNDNCFGSAFTGGQDKLAAYKKLGIELTKRNIRLIPVGMDAPDTTNSDPWAALFGPGLVGTNLMNLKTNYEALGAMLANGGSALKDVPRIDTAAKLKELVSVVGGAVNNCRFTVPDTLDSSKSVNPFEVSFSINGKAVPRDRHQQNGWDFVHGSTSEVEFFGQGCQALQSGMTVTAGKSCEQNICGTAAVSVSTKPRDVLLLLDSSGSRIECVDGSLSCLSVPTDPNHTLTYWEVVQRAVSAALVAPVNDDVSFGMQFFPSKNAEQLSCDVATAPEIPPAPSRQIAIMKAMLEKIPLGLSPDVGIMESVAAQPGQLADPNAIGAVVLLSDGGDNCSGDTQAQIVSRLGAAAKKLLDRGVRTFAIRYGSTDGETPDQAAQLNAISQNGGTARTGSVAYIDAKTPDELEAALAGISDQLATCSFTLGNVASTVDRNRANLYLDGEQIGFDATATKQNGWSWMDQAQTTIELYGDACKAFKTNRHTNIVVEFGCMPVVIKGPD